VFERAEARSAYTNAQSGDSNHNAVHRRGRSGVGAGAQTSSGEESEAVEEEEKQDTDGVFCDRAAAPVPRRGAAGTARAQPPPLPSQRLVVNEAVLAQGVLTKRGARQRVGCKAEVLIRGQGSSSWREGTGLVDRTNRDPHVFGASLLRGTNGFCSVGAEAVKQVECTTA
jgi:hypothetical protein